MTTLATHARPQSLLATCDQWVSATHTGTAVEGHDGALMLSWLDAELVEPAEGEPCIARGLATDRLCRIYALRQTGVDRLMVGPTASGLDYALLPDPTTIVGEPPETEIGTTAGVPEAGADFQRVPTSALVDAVGIAIDGNDRLFISDRARRTISVIDLWSHRLLRSIRVATPAHPRRTPHGLAYDQHGDRGSVWAVVSEPDGLLRFSATRGPVEESLPASVADLPPDATPSRVAVLPDGTVAVMYHEPNGDGWLIAGTRAPRNVGPASDMIVDAEGAVVIAPCPAPDGRATLRRFTPTADGWTRSTPLNADGYNGTGLVLTRDGRIGYFSDRGFRLAVIGAVEYLTEGSCITYRLDSGVPRNRWGRAFLEACVPNGTSVSVGMVSSDDEFVTAMAHGAAEPAACVPAVPAATPPLPPDLLTPATPGDDANGALHRRHDPITPWWYAEARFETLEAPVLAAPGRYLWVTLRLTGNSRRTPMVRELRVERHTHTLMRRLPTVFSADEQRAEFLHRYLAPLDGILHDLELRSRCRHILLDPHAAPAEALDWLASFFGLVLDGRWAEAAQRQLIAEIVPLYRARGTVASLARYMQIFLAGEHAQDSNRPQVAPIIVEHFRLRGLGGPLLGGDPTISSRSVVGHGFRVGGAVGELDVAPLDPEDDETSAFTSAAHRFTVLIPQSLSAEQDAAIRHILDTERPAHTTYELCTVDAGMRVGHGLHVGMSSIIGPTGSFDAAITDLALLGRGTILGGPTTGIAVEAGRVGQTTRIG